MPIKAVIKRLAALTFAAAATAAVLAKDVDLVSPPPFSFACLSPDGKSVAAAYEAGKDDRYVLVVDVENAKRNTASISDGEGGEAIVEGLLWVSPEHLAITARGAGDSIRLHIYQPGKSPERRTRDGKTKLLRAIPQSTRFLVSEITESEGVTACRVLEYDAASEADPVELYATQSKNFEAVADTQGRLRLVKHDDGSGQDLAWYAIYPASGQQKRLSTIKHWNKVHGIIEASNSAIVSGHINTQYPSIYTYDFEKDEIVETLADNSEFSLDTFAKAVFSPVDGAVLGLHLDLFNRSTIWTDEAFAALQEQVDTKMAGSSNRIIGWTQDRSKLLICRYLPSLPDQILLYSVADEKITPVLLNGPSVKPEQISNSRLVRLPTRSGEELTAVLTVPQKKKGDKYPLLVWIRDGIWSGLDRLEWHPQANFFADDGFVVLRINYSGTEGLLGPLAAKQDSKANVLQLFNDIEDSVKTLVDFGLVDASKVTIGGEKAGAWAAAYAPIASPGNYVAVASLNGVYELVEYRKDMESGAYALNAGYTLEFAKPGSGLSDGDLLSLSVTPNIPAGRYAEDFFVTVGKWSNGEYKTQLSDLQKALKKAKVSVKAFSDDWWGSNFEFQTRFGAYDRAASLLEAAVK